MTNDRFATQLVTIDQTLVGRGALSMTEGEQIVARALLSTPTTSITITIAEVVEYLIEAREHVRLRGVP